MSAIPSPNLRVFLSEAVNLAPERLANVRATVTHLREQLARHVRDSEEFGLIEILNSGSVEKKTAITPLNDVDLAVLLRPELAAGHELPDLLERVRDLLVQVYHPKPAEDYSLGRHAVRIRFHDTKLSVDVVPLIPDLEDKDFALLPTRDSDEWVATSIPLHLEFIRKRIRQHPAFLELVRLTKWWRNEQQVHFKSFLVELIWAHLLDTRTVTGDDLGEALLGFFGYIVRTGLLEPISFDDYDQKPDPEAFTSPVRVFDPVNPENNVAGRITPSRRNELVSACREAFEALAAAQTAPTAAVARGYYQRVFGPRFNLPRDTPGEATSPTSKEHVEAKLHADLRQLRLLNGGFDAAAEDSYARALSLWIDRGLAFEIEFAYYDPATRERIVSLQYKISEDLVVPGDDDPAGIPIIPVDAARFAIYVTGNDAWKEMERRRRGLRFARNWVAGAPPSPSYSTMDNGSATACAPMASSSPRVRSTAPRMRIWPHALADDCQVRRRAGE
jgi:hypothetical protein